MTGKNDFKKALEQVRSNSQKRNFKQAIDLIINVKDLNLKKPEEQVDTFVILNHLRGKKIKVAALVGPELKDAAKAACDTVILHSDFAKLTKKRDIQKLANDHDFFIAQANIMPDVAKTFGRIFGPRGKMPNPKAGCVVPPNANLTALVERLQKIVKVSIKTQLSFKCRIGTEEMSDDHIIDNLTTVYTALTHALPQEDRNIKNIMLKFTMDKPIVVGK